MTYYLVKANSEYLPYVLIREDNKASEWSDTIEYLLQFPVFGANYWENPRGLVNGKVTTSSINAGSFNKLSIIKQFEYSDKNIEIPTIDYMTEHFPEIFFMTYYLIKSIIPHVKKDIAYCLLDSDFHKTPWVDSISKILPTEFEHFRFASADYLNPSDWANTNNKEIIGTFDELPTLEVICSKYPELLL